MTPTPASPEAAAQQPEPESSATADIDTGSAGTQRLDEVSTDGGLGAIGDADTGGALSERHDLSDILAQLEDDPDPDGLAPASAPEVGTRLTDARDLVRPNDDKIVVTTEGGLEFDPTFASFVKRFIAFLIDSIILSVALIPGLALIVFGGSTVLILLGMIVGLAGFALVAMLSARSVAANRQWIGNRIAGTYVVDAVNGSNLDVASALTRFALRHVVSSILLVGFIMALADGQRRAFHDRFAGSVVIGREREVWTAGD